MQEPLCSDWVCRRWPRLLHCRRSSYRSRPRDRRSFWETCFFGQVCARSRTEQGRRGYHNRKEKKGRYFRRRGGRSDDNSRMKKIKNQDACSLLWENLGHHAWSKQVSRFFNSQFRDDQPYGGLRCGRGPSQWGPRKANTVETGILPMGKPEAGRTRSCRAGGGPNSSSVDCNSKPRNRAVG